MTRVKICCISSLQEARLAIQYGADALGLVGQMPCGPGTIEDELIASITRQVPPPVATFLLTSETHTGDIIRHHSRVQTNTLQLVDALEEEAYADLRSALPTVKIVQVIHVTDKSTVSDAIRISPMVDALLLDSGNPKLPTKQLGGTGRTHDWSLSRRIVEEADAPVFLAGGLTPENVLQAIAKVRPYGVDVCSGLRTDGRLDETKLSNFFQAVSG